MLRHQISIRSSWFSPTTLGACSKYRPIRFRRVCSARVAFPTARLQSLHANAMSVGLLPGTLVLLTRCGRPSARQVPVLRGQVVRSAWAPPGLVCCHCQLYVSRGRHPTSSQSRCTSHSGSTLSLICRVLDPCAPSAPARASLVQLLR